MNDIFPRGFHGIFPGDFPLKVHYDAFQKVSSEAACRFFQDFRRKTLEGFLSVFLQKFLYKAFQNFLHEFLHKFIHLVPLKILSEVFPGIYL